ncbi:MAG: hypothetical protein KUG77_05685 [Nannocystaceae bacterium]|nr:hypothetical protein [Nannocystaceae bacterium]
MRTLLLVMAASLSVGCTTLADVSSGQIGCSPEEITVAEDGNKWAARTWTAECTGVTYQCSAHGGGEGATAQVACTPQAGAATPGGSNAAAPEPATPAGCGFDTQCKGERICEAGTCVAPAPLATPPTAAEPTPAPVVTAPPPA